MRHLASMGYRLTYEQDPRTEFDYNISTMSLDLRSGVRLLRAAEILTGKPLCGVVLCILGHWLGMPGQSQQRGGLQ